MGFSSLPVSASLAFTPETTTVDASSARKRRVAELAAQPAIGTCEEHLALDTLMQGATGVRGLHGNLHDALPASSCRGAEALARALAPPHVSRSDGGAGQATAVRNRLQESFGQQLVSATGGSVRLRVLVPARNVTGGRVRVVPGQVLCWIEVGRHGLVQAVLGVLGSRPGTFMIHGDGQWQTRRYGRSGT